MVSCWIAIRRRVLRKKNGKVDFSENAGLRLPFRHWSSQISPVWVVTAWNRIGSEARIHSSKWRLVFSSCLHCKRFEFTVLQAHMCNFQWKKNMLCNFDTFQWKSLSFQKARKRQMESYFAVILHHFRVKKRISCQKASLHTEGNFAFRGKCVPIKLGLVRIHDCAILLGTSRDLEHVCSQNNANYAFVMPLLIPRRALRSLINWDLNPHFWAKNGATLTSAHQKYTSQFCLQIIWTRSTGDPLTDWHWLHLRQTQGSFVAVVRGIFPLYDSATIIRYWQVCPQGFPGHYNAPCTCRRSSARPWQQILQKHMRYRGCHCHRFWWSVLHLAVPDDFGC